jgi:hypothetical protein
MDKIQIEWKHYDKEGNTCNRCNTTGTALIEAIGAMKVDSHFAGIKIEFKETKLSEDNLSDSNIILLNGTPLEILLKDTKVVNTPCKSCCEMVGSDVDCRALDCQGQIFEDIPQNFIYQAAMKLLEKEVKV